MSDLFNEKAKDYDFRSTVMELASAVSKSILEKITFNPQMKVLDFGAGTGLISSSIAPLVNKIKAVDISQAMLDRLIEKKELQGKVDIVCRDIIKNPLKESFDVIVSAMAMHHVKDTQSLIKCFAEHLKPGAMIVLVDLDREDGTFHKEGTEGVFHLGFEREELKFLLEKGGFKNINFTTAHVLKKEGKDYSVFLVVANI